VSPSQCVGDVECVAQRDLLGCPARCACLLVAVVIARAEASSAI
jgi:hypothetical protein